MKKIARLSLVIGLLMAVNSIVYADERKIENGTVQVSAFDLPISALMSEEEKRGLQKSQERLKDFAQAFGSCPNLHTADLKDIPQVRRCREQAVYKTVRYKELLARYAVKITPKIISNVYTESFSPVGGVSAPNTDRILIHLHGGGFITGSRWSGRFGSIPVSSIGKIKVISIDYRMAPVHKFPAGTDDVEVVYRELLKSYKPENIGIYGCSAGAILTAQSVARFQEKGLPSPGATGMLCGAASQWSRSGDFMHMGAAIAGGEKFLAGLDKLVVSGPRSYFRGEDMSSPAIAPAESDEVLSHFPPSVLISSTRDYHLSNVIDTHRKLVRLGVETELHIWEGLDHAAFTGDIILPQFHEVHSVLVNFFDKNLGK